MKFLADECCDHGLVENLRKTNHEVLYIAETYSGLTDDDVLTMAFNEQRILLTEDKDFGELVYRLRKPAHGIILIRIGVKNKSLKWPQLKNLIDKYSERCPGSFVVIDEEKFRFRPLLFVL